MEANPPITAMLGLVLVVGCAGTSVPSGQSPKDSVPATEAVNSRCVRQADVTLHVENQSSHSIAIFFGSTQVSTGVEPSSTAEREVPRSYLERPIRLVITGPGLAGDPPTSIRTQPVVCNDATLVIGQQLSLSYFVGS